MKNCLITLLFISTICQAQDKSVFPNGWLLLEQGVSIDSICLLYANSILSTPDDNEDATRNDMLNDINGWFLKNSGKEHLLGKKTERENGIELNNYTLKIGCADTISMGDEKIFTYNGYIVVYYIVCLTKAFTENKKLSDTEIKIQATEYLIEYIFQKQNYTDNSVLSYEKIMANDFLKSLNSRENIRRFIDSLESD